MALGHNIVWVVIVLMLQSPSAEPIWKQGKTPTDHKINNSLSLSLRTKLYHIGGEKKARSQTIQIPLVHEFTTISSYYIIEINLGTPTKSFWLIFDTGSPMLWLQADDCEECFPVIGQLYSSKRSRTFAKVPCADERCVSKRCFPDRSCGYYIKYDKDKESSGAVGLDDFQFQSDDYEDEETLRVIFGVGTYNEINYHTMFNPDFNRISGIFGFGLGKYSFIQQFESDQTGLMGKFQFCIPSTFSTKTGLIRFGSAADDFPPTAIVYTIPIDSDYHVSCTGISVGGTKLELRNSKAWKNGRLEMLVDSGSPKSTLPRDVRSLLFSTVKSYISKNPIKPYQKGSLKNSTNCFYRSEEFNLPSITYHFGYSKYVLAHDAVFLIKEKYFCILIDSSSMRLSILGLNGLMDQLILIDTYTMSMSFTPHEC